MFFIAELLNLVLTAQVQGGTVIMETYSNTGHDYSTHVCAFSVSLPQVWFHRHVSRLSKVTTNLLFPSLPPEAKDI